MILSALRWAEQRTSEDQWRAPAAQVDAGRLARIHAGRCEIGVALTIHEIEVLTKRAHHLELPGVKSLRSGLRLLPASEYPASEYPASGYPGSEPLSGEYQGGAHLGGSVPGIGFAESRFPAVALTGAERVGTEHQGSQYSGTEHPSSQYPGTEHASSQYASSQHPSPAYSGSSPANASSSGSWRHISLAPKTPFGVLPSVKVRCTCSR